jgi:hypothetical protein
MDRVYPSLPGHGQHGLDVEISESRTRTQSVGFVGIPDMRGGFLSIAEYRDRYDAQFPASSHDPQRDLATIGDQQALD